MAIAYSMENVSMSPLFCLIYWNCEALQTWQKCCNIYKKEFCLFNSPKFIKLEGTTVNLTMLITHLWGSKALSCALLSITCDIPWLRNNERICLNRKSFGECLIALVLKWTFAHFSVLVRSKILQNLAKPKIFRCCTAFISNSWLIILYQDFVLYAVNKR